MTCHLVTYFLGSLKELQEEIVQSSLKFLLVYTHAHTHTHTYVTAFKKEGATAKQVYLFLKIQKKYLGKQNQSVLARRFQTFKDIPST